MSETCDCIKRANGTCTTQPVVEDVSKHIRVNITEPDWMIAHLMPNVDHLEVLIHSHTYLLETITSNIALYLPTSEPNTPGWITPRLDKEPFLNGVMRHYLLDEGVIRQGRVTADDWDKVKREGGRVIGFNGLRWVGALT